MSTKINATAVTLGNSTGFAMTPGQACGFDGADAFLPRIESETVFADKGFDADQRVIEPLLVARKEPVILSKRGRKQLRPYDQGTL